MLAVLTILRWMAFLLSICGWFSFVFDRTKLKPAFIPVVTLTGLTVVLFSFGMLHLLQVTAWMLSVLGWGFLIFYFVSALRKRFSFSFFLTTGFCFFFVASALFVPMVWGVHVYHYDNFSHWATVLWEMLSFQDFPTAQTIVVFRDYMPGTASFLYWFCSVVGVSEDIALMGQGLFSCAALMPLFYRIEKTRSVRFWSTCILTVILTCLLVFDDGTLQVYNLLVDSLIGFIALSIWFLREEYRHRPVYGWIMMIPLFIFLIFLKTNAILLLVFFSVVLLYDSRKCALREWKRWIFLAPVGAPYLWYYMWKIYRDVTYGAPTNSYSFHGISQTIRERTPAFYEQMFRCFWDKISDLSLVYVVTFLVLNLLMIGGILFLRSHKVRIKPLFRTFILANGMLLGYTGALLFMYGFIMAPGEAIHLAAFERYIMTPVILFVAMQVESLSYFFSLYGKDKKFSVRLIPLYFVLLLFPLVSKASVQLVSRPDFQSTERGMVISALQESAEIIPRNARVAMFNGARGREDLYYYLMMYELKSRACLVWDFSQTEGDLLWDLQALKDYEYLVIAAQHPDPLSALQKVGYDVQWDPDCVLYRISNVDGAVSLVPAMESTS